MKRVLLAVIFSLTSQVCLAGNLPEKYQKWLNYEVAYVISAQERAEFSKLTTDVEREAFIDRFWRIRATDSSTEENEFKKEHYARIQYANDHFGEGIPGWKSERGRIWIMHGPPDDIHYDYGGGSVAIDIEAPTAVITQDSNPDKRRYYRLSLNKPETETWVYRNIGGARNFTSYFEVMFSRTDPDHIYFLNQSLRKFSRGTLTYGERLERDYAIMTFLRGHFFGGPYRIVYAGEYRFQDLEDFYQSLFHPQRSPRIEVTEFQMGLQDLERSTGEVLMEKIALGRSLKEKVRSRIFFEELPLSVRVGSLSSSSGSTMLPVSLGMADIDTLGHLLTAKDDRMDVLLELVRDDGEVVASLIDSVKVHAQHKLPSTSEKFLYQTRLVARPGHYQLHIYAALQEHKAAAVRELQTVLPDYNAEGLGMSDLLLFEKVLPKKTYEEMRAKAPDLPQFLGRTSPVFLKDFALIPSCDSRFRRGQHLTAFFEVYNPGLPAGEKTPGLQVRCRFKRTDGMLVELPEKQLNYLTDSTSRRTTYGISIPLMGFTTGDYSVEFDVYDSVRGRSVSRAASFTIY